MVKWKPQGICKPKLYHFSKLDNYLQNKIALKLHQCRFENLPVCSNLYKNNTLKNSNF